MFSLKTILKQIFNLESDIAYNGEEAIDRIKEKQLNYHNEKQNFKIIFMDLNMPVMNGIQTTNKLKEMY